MILIDNVVFLKKKFPVIWDQIKKLETNQNVSLNLQVISAKDGTSTLTVDVDGRPMYVHSKYNPREEAEQFIARFSNIDKYQHIFLYGIGMGYHLDALMAKYPDKTYTLYEPEVEIFASYLARVSLNSFPENQLKTIYIERDITGAGQFIKQYVNNLNEEILLVQLPSYERIFATKHKYFSDLFVDAVSQKKLLYRVNSAFEKRWTYNSMINLEITRKTPNIIMQKKEIFQDRPVIVVAAGPSLQEEIENLKYIKEHGLAYIFSVGTSINALLANGIEPDAACTYDPSAVNQRVFERMKQEGKDYIPLIYGSSVGFEVIKNYAGPKLHMITNQDAVSGFYLKSKDSNPLEVIQDASSISVIVLQLLSKLKCNPVILVGQNFAFKNNQVYSTGAAVLRDSMVSTGDKAELVQVESVDGGLIDTNKDYNVMRFQMEMFTRLFTEAQIINTTNGGAKIANTTYIPLKDLITSKLLKRVVKPNWFSSDGSCYDLDYTNNQVSVMTSEFEAIKLHFIQITRLLQDLNRLAEGNQKKPLVKLFHKFDKMFTKIQENSFFITFIKPMNRVPFDLLMQNMEGIRFLEDDVFKARKVIQEFGKFIYGCHSDTLNIEELFTAMHSELIPLMKKEG